MSDGDKVDIVPHGILAIRPSTNQTGQLVRLSITSKLHGSAGKMIVCKFAETVAFKEVAAAACSACNASSSTARLFSDITPVDSDKSWKDAATTLKLSRALLQSKFYLMPRNPYTFRVPASRHLDSVLTGWRTLWSRSTCDPTASAREEGLIREMLTVLQTDCAGDSKFPKLSPDGRAALIQLVATVKAGNESNLMLQFFQQFASFTLSSSALQQECACHELFELLLQSNSTEYELLNSIARLGGSKCAILNVLNCLRALCAKCKELDIQQLVGAAANGDCDTVKKLRERGVPATRLWHGKRDLSICNWSWFGLDAITAAATGGHLEVLKVLIESVNLDEHIVIVNSKKLAISCTTRQQLFGELNAVKLPCLPIVVSPLMLAAYHGHQSIVRFLLAQGANVNGSPTQHLAPLELAIIAGHVDVVRILIQAGARVNAFGHHHLNKSQSSGEISTPQSFPWSRPALRLAAETGRVDIMKLLIKHGADLYARGNLVGTALAGAAKHGKMDAVQYLVDVAVARSSDGCEGLGAFVDRAGDFESGEGSTTALTLAAKYGHYQIVRLLLECRCGLGMADELHSLCVRALVCTIEGLHWIEMLHKNEMSTWRGEPFSIEYRNQGIRIIYNEDSKYATDASQGVAIKDPVQYLANDCLGLNAPLTGQGGTEIGGLHAFGCKDNYLKLVQMLSTFGGGNVVGAKIAPGSTPLIMAAEWGMIDVVQILLGEVQKQDAKTMLATVNSVCSGAGRGCTDLHCKCSVASHNGTAIARAARGGHVDVVKVLHANRAKINEHARADILPRTTPALIQAVLSQDPTTVEYLLDAGAHLEALNPGTIEITAGERLHCQELTTCQDVDVAREKYEEGGETALWIAASTLQSDTPNGETRSLEILTMLLERGANVNHKVLFGNSKRQPQTALMAAAHKGNRQNVETLLSYGAPQDMAGTPQLRRGNPLEKVHHNCTARDFAIHCSADVPEASKSRLLQFLDHVMSSSDDMHSPARLAIQCRRIRALKAGLRFHQITFHRMDPRGTGLVDAALSVAPWPDAPSICQATIAVARAVELVAKIGWHAKSPWCMTTHWLHPVHVREAAKLITLCLRRAQIYGALPCLPQEILECILSRALRKQTT